MWLSYSTINSGVIPTSLSQISLAIWPPGLWGGGGHREMYAPPIQGFHIHYFSIAIIIVLLKELLCPEQRQESVAKGKGGYNNRLGLDLL
jgi:hypothetical protein